MNVRFKFSRKGPVKYLGHLDMMRYFQKAVLRAEIDMKYSEGFNPHQIMSFAYPLGVSMETEGDYMDLEILSFDSVDSLVDSLNRVMNEGIKIVSANIVPDDELNAMASVAAASYRVTVSENISDKEIDSFMSNNEIVITREGKKGAVTKDIKPGIFELKNLDGTLFMFLKSGSSLNIKPLDVINAINEYSGKNIKIENITRIDIFRLNKDEKLVPLSDFN